MANASWYSDHSFKNKAHPQISALAISQHTLVATFWGSNETLVIALPDLKVSQLTPSVEPSAASAVLLTNFGVRTVSSDETMADHSS
jgi:hypothetical protein